jgi:hypothetical protein
MRDAPVRPSDATEPGRALVERALVLVHSPFARQGILGACWRPVDRGGSGAGPIPSIQ